MARQGRCWARKMAEITNRRLNAKKAATLGGGQIVGFRAAAGDRQDASADYVRKPLCDTRRVAASGNATRQSPRDPQPNVPPSPTDCWGRHRARIAIRGLHAFQTLASPSP